MKQAKSLSLMRKSAIIFIGLLCGLCGLSQTLPDGFSDEVVAEGLDRPVGIVFDEAGQGYVWDKAGRVFVLAADGQLLDQPLLDLSEEVGDWDDHGLMSVALHPAFLINGYIYLLYVVDRHHLMTYGTPEYDSTANWYKEATIARITRYRCDPASGFRQILPGSRKVILGATPDDGFPILMVSHGAGTLAFGSDGTLLASCGDGASFESVDAGSDPHTYFAQALEDGILTEKTNIGSWRAQLVDALNGKIIRIDPETGEGVPSNPWYDADRPRAARSRVWTLGLRQPFRFFVDTHTGSHLPQDGRPGRIVVGDVGAGGWEEINVVDTAGRNLGWPFWEGFDPNWGHYLEPAPNPDAPNPLYGQNGCDQAFFTFHDLIHQPRAGASSEAFVNPCDPTQLVPPEVPVFVHHRPALSWSNRLWNPPPRALLPAFDAEGNAATVELGSPEAPAAGQPFDGYSAFAGFVYEGDNFPEEWHGKIFIADFSGWIRALTLDDEGTLTAVDTFLQTTKGIVHLALNPTDGCLYYVHIFEGTVRRVCHGGTPRPVAVIALDRQYGPSPLTVQFDGTQASHPFGWPLTWHWDFGDGTTSTEVSPVHVFEAPDGAPRSWTVTLTVRDSLGQEDQAEVIVSANNTPPQVTITSPAEGAAFPMTDYSFVQLSAEVSDAEHDTAALDWTWQVFFHHNLHYHPEPPLHARRPWVVFEPVGCAGELYWYRVQVRVTDPGGLTTVAERELHPWCASDEVEVAWVRAEAEQGGVALAWQVDSPWPVRGSVVERYRHRRFEPVGRVDANGQLRFSATWFDEVPLAGKNRYRLRIELEDGRWTYGTQREVFYLPEGEARAWPNPASESLYVQLEKAMSDRIELRLYDLAGKRLTRQRFDAEPDRFFEAALPVSDLPTGWYVWQLIDGKRQFGGRVLVVR